MQKLPHMKNRHLHPLFSAIGRCKNCRAFFRTQKIPENIAGSELMPTFAQNIR